MKTKRGAPPGVPAVVMGVCALVASGLAGCAGSGSTTPDPLLPDQRVAAMGRKSARLVRFTGGLQLVWPGGNGAGAPEAPGRVAEADLTAFPGVPEGDPGPGSFTYRVVNADGTIHREILVRLIWVGLEDQQVTPGAIRFVGVATSDTKPCGIQQGGGGCAGEEGGCTNDGSGCTGEEGGCTHDDGRGCSGTVGTGGGEPGGMGGSGGRVTGADCRVGQIVVGWALDGGTPAVNGDRISWKWFAPDAPKVDQIFSALDAGQPVPWPCSLCEKVILGGNLTMYLN